MSTSWRWFGNVVAVLGIALTFYGAGGMIGGAIPVNAGWRPPASGVRISIESNGVHTGLVLPVVAAGVDWRDLVRASDIADPRYAWQPYLSFGWGDRAFYLETPTWSDVRPGTVLAAAVGSDRTVVHVDHIAAPRVGEDVRSIVLRPEEYRRLAAAVQASFKAQGGHRHGYAAYDAFYNGTGRYDAVHTCNEWTGRALRTAGVRVGAWTPFPVTVLGWFPA